MSRVAKSLTNMPTIRSGNTNNTTIMKERTRVPKGEKYWFLAYDSIRDKGINVLPSEEECCIVDFNRCELGNYFHTKEEAESMARKLRAVLKGADVIEVPSEEEVVYAKPVDEFYIRPSVEQYETPRR